MSTILRQDLKEPSVPPVHRLSTLLRVGTVENPGALKGCESLMKSGQTTADSKSRLASLPLATPVGTRPRGGSPFSISQRGTGRTCKMKAPLRKVQLENIPVHPEMTKEYAPGDSALEENPSFSRTSRDPHTVTLLPSAETSRRCSNCLMPTRTRAAPS